MDFFKKAKSQVKGAVQDAQGMYGQYKQQQQQGHPTPTNYQTSPSYYQQGYTSPNNHQPQNGQQHMYGLPPQSYTLHGSYQPTNAPQPYSYYDSNAPSDHGQPPANYGQSPEKYPSYQQAPIQHSQPPNAAPMQTSAYNLRSLGESLPNMQPQQSSFQHIGVSLSGVPTAEAALCPKFQPFLADSIDLYVLAPHVLNQVQPALEPDNVAICGPCFSAHVAQHPHLASNFQLRERAQIHPDGPRASFEKFVACDLALPTVRTLFYRDCIPRGTIMPLLQYARFVITLPVCAEAIVQHPTEYYESRLGDGFGCCKTCFEWFLRGTPFEQEMILQNPAADWICDIGIRGFSFRAMIGELESSRPDFKRFSTKAKQRNALPLCPGVGNPIAPASSTGPHFNYEPPNGKPGVLCQACFYDKVLGTSMEPHFNLYNELERQYYGSICCELASNFPTFAMKSAIRFNNDEVWRLCLAGRDKFPACIGVEGIDEETLLSADPQTTTWYHHNQHPTIEICPLHYSATISVLGATDLFTPLARPLQPGIIRQCYLSEPPDLSLSTSDPKNFPNTLTWRGTILHNWLHYSYDLHNDFTAFNTAAAKIATYPPPCPFGKRAFKPINSRKYYGNHFVAQGDPSQTGISVCEECYLNIIKGSPLEHFVGVDLTIKTNSRHPDGFCCNTSSLRAKRELKTACDTNDFLHFTRYYTARKDCERRRKEIDDKCNRQAELQKIDLMRLNMANQAAAINLMGQLNANTNATMMRIGGSVAEASATDYGQRYGNSTVGYGYLTAAGANAAQASMNAQGVGKQGVSLADFRPSGDTWSDTQVLLRLAREVEEEWKLIE